MATVTTGLRKRVPDSVKKPTRRRTNLAPFLFVLPAVLFYFVFKIVPMFGGLPLAFLRWDGIEPPVFVGVDNFTRMFEDELIPLALGNNIKYAAGTVIMKTALSLFTALLLNQALRGRGFYRTTLFTPVVMSFVVVGLLWTWIFNAQIGLVNSLMHALGLDFLIQDWLGDPHISLPSMLVVDTWRWYGFHMVIFLAGLQTIPIELYEAARMDGASRWRQFANITLPLLKPVLLVNVTFALLGGFNAFDIPYIMTEGGPANSTLVMALHIYIRGFKFYKFGYATAMSYVWAVFITILSIIQFRVLSRNTDNN
ncbi:MAG: sugar ABC transporter permease [Chloroflexi bacterium]|nr:sugar ABC transporter permease [Chloroflexota bacterium]